MYNFLLWVMGILFSYLYANILPFSMGISIFVGVILGFITSLLIIVISIIIFGFILLKLPLNSKFKKWYIDQAAKIACNLLGLKYKVYGKENIPTDVNYIVCPNHKSMLDVVLIYLAFPNNMGFMAKKPLFKIPFVRTYMKAMGCFPVDRENDREAAKEMVKAIRQIKNGIPMGVFPEGGVKDRTTGKMVDVKAGAYKMATKTESAILPVSMINNRFIGERSPWRTTKVEIHIHKPIF